MLISNKQKNFQNFSKILKVLLLSPFLISMPFFNGNYEAKAGLEFQWDQNTGYRRLKWFQKNNERRVRNTIFFFLRPFDRQAGLLKINMKIPKNFKSTLNKEKISLCQVKIGGFETRTKCIKNIPADIEINTDELVIYKEDDPDTDDVDESTQVQERLTQRLRIPIDKAYMQTKIIDKEGNIDLANQDNFNLYFKGIFLNAYFFIAFPYVAVFI